MREHKMLLLSPYFGSPFLVFYLGESNPEFTTQLVLDFNRPSKFIRGIRLRELPVKLKRGFFFETP